MSAASCAVDCCGDCGNGNAEHRPGNIHLLMRWVPPRRARDTFKKMKGPKTPGDELDESTLVLTGAEVRERSHAVGVVLEPFKASTCNCTLTSVKASHSFAAWHGSGVCLISLPQCERCGLGQSIWCRSTSSPITALRSH